MSEPQRTLAHSCLNAGLLFLRLGACFLLFHVHGWPKVLHYSEELARIENPFGLGAQSSLLFAIFAEVVCPLFIAAGWFARLACLHILILLAVAMFIVHGDWSVADGQFGWLLLLCFGTIALTGPGQWTVPAQISSHLSGQRA